MKREFRPDIQGLRAIAVALVVLSHAGVSVLDGGFVGVDVFFVISGFLITTHLVESIEASRLRLRDFYSRRIRRLLPAALIVLALTAATVAIWFPPLMKPKAFVEIAAAALYGPNILFAVSGTDYFAGTDPSVVQHYWSLGVEEQFYLFWPLLLLLAWWVFKRSRRGLFVAVAIITVVSFALAVVVTDYRQPLAFFLLPTRAWQLGVGALVALAVIAAPKISEYRWWKAPLAWAGLVGIAAAALLYGPATPYPSWYAALPVLAAAAAILGGTGATRYGPAAVLAIRPAQFIGKISYSLYLVHWPLIIVPQVLFGWREPLPFWVPLILAAAAIPLAWLLWRFVEEPGRRGTWKWTASAKRTLIVGLAASLAFAVVLVPSAVVVQRLPVDAGRAAPAFVLSKSPVGTAFVPNNLTPNLWAGSGDIPGVDRPDCVRDYDNADPTGCAYGSATGAPTVALFGDSHAASWIPALEALADDGTIQMTRYTKRGCPSAFVEDVLVDTSPYPNCNEWRRGVIDLLRADPPDVVVLANHAELYFPYTDDYGAALSRTIQELNPSTRVIVVGDVPSRAFDPQDCLSAHLQDALTCASPVSEAVNPRVVDAERGAAQATGAAYLDLQPYFCTDVCPLIMGDVQTYLDGNHVTATFSRYFAPVFKDAILAELTPASG
ncbi:MAG: acyltransferase family protein [Pseudolysinimonas sp.]|uniref:acyltransferase family protein n=1 Tax=Pseudolysinimonas sp. TaxID=2680009 RepID=UPI003267163B